MPVIDEVEDWIDEAKERLKEWGAEERKQLRIMLDEGGEPKLKGWDGQTIAYALMRHGGRAPMGSGMRKEEDRPKIVSTDAIVSALFEQHRAGEEVRSVLYAHYVFKFSIRQGARITHRSERAYRDLLEMGQAWVAGGLSTLNVCNTEIAG